MPPSSDWARRRAAIYCEVLPPESGAATLTNFLDRLCDRLLAGTPGGLSVLPVATLRQSSFLLEGKGEGLVCFDLVQSLALKSLAFLFGSAALYPAMGQVLRDCCALSLARNAPGHMARLQQASFPAGPTHFVHRHEQLTTFVKEAAKWHPGMTLPGFLALVDAFLLAHEVFHYFASHDFPTARHYLTMSDRSFEFALEQVCYEDHPDFHHIARMNGTIDVDASGLDRIRRDLKARRVHYLANRTALREEIACDAFAFHVVHQLADQWPGDDRTRALRGLGWYYLVWMLNDLHQAMLRRAGLSSTSGILSEKPGAIADSTLRATAIVHYAAWLATEPDSDTDPEYRACLASLTEWIWPLKTMMSGLYVMPVTRAMRDWFLAAESGSPPSGGGKSSPSGERAWAWFDPTRTFPAEVRATTLR